MIHLVKVFIKRNTSQEDLIKNLLTWLIIMEFGKTSSIFNSCAEPSREVRRTSGGMRRRQA